MNPKIVRNATFRLPRLMLLLIVPCLLASSLAHATSEAWIVGRGSWWSVGDHIQFVGDCTYGTPTCANAAPEEDACTP